jgi:hypothetical protein
MGFSSPVVTAGCTIVSRNYLAYARTLYQSFIRHNPDSSFFVLVVDRSSGADYSDEPFEVIEVTKLPIENFESVAFRFDIVELNTNVKASFMKFLIRERGISRLAYLDPDIAVYRPMSHVFDLLGTHNILLTPHCNSPITDELRPSEQDFLVNGVFNLGFVAVSDHPQALAFLDWWEERCLTLGFSETRTGLFVDQKWVNFAPCFFDGVHVLKDPGCNVAYWNLHERVLEERGGEWRVNGEPLTFFHFSGIGLDDEDQISRHQNRYDLNGRPELRPIFDEYRTRLHANGLGAARKEPYGFGSFSNGDPVTVMARRLYAVHQDCFGAADPFDAEGAVYEWCRKHGFLGPEDESGKFNSMTYREDDPRIRIIQSGLRLALKLLGFNRYNMLMKYLSYITVLRNQKSLFKPETT